MRDVWCAACGVYVSHDPTETHHAVLDVPSSATRTSRGSLTRRFSPWLAVLVGVLGQSEIVRADSQQPDPIASISVDQVQSAFATAGYEVDQPYRWTWTSPPVTSMRVWDPSSDRVLLVLVYPDVAAAEVEHDRAMDRDVQPVDGDPYLVRGYGPSVWKANIALVQSTQSQLDRLYGHEVNGDMRSSVARSAAVLDAEFPNTAVDLDFVHALNSGAANL